MKLVGRSPRMLVWSTCIGIAAFSLCAVSATDDRWKSITTSRKPLAWLLTGGSTVTLAAHSKVDYNSASSSVNLRSGRVDINLIGKNDSVRVSTAQVFIRETAGGGGHFFVINERSQSTIGVCRGQVNVLANNPLKGRSDEAAETGTITIEAGEQAIIKSNGETFRETDPPPTCEG